LLKLFCPSDHIGDHDVCFGPGKELVDGKTVLFEIEGQMVGETKKLSVVDFQGLRVSLL